MFGKHVGLSWIHQSPRGQRIRQITNLSSLEINLDCNWCTHGKRKCRFTRFFVLGQYTPKNGKLDLQNYQFPVLHHLKRRLFIILFLFFPSLKLLETCTLYQLHFFQLLLFSLQFLIHWMLDFHMYYYLLIGLNVFGNVTG